MFKSFSVPVPFGNRCVYLLLRVSLLVLIFNYSFFVLNIIYLLQKFPMGFGIIITFNAIFITVSGGNECFKVKISVSS